MRKGRRKDLVVQSLMEARQSTKESEKKKIKKKTDTSKHCLVYVIITLTRGMLMLKCNETRRNENVGEGTRRNEMSQKFPV